LIAPRSLNTSTPLIPNRPIMMQPGLTPVRPVVGECQVERNTPEPFSCPSSFARRTQVFAPPPTFSNLLYLLGSVGNGLTLTVFIPLTHLFPAQSLYVPPLPSSSPSGFKRPSFRSRLWLAGHDSRVLWSHFPPSSFKPSCWAILGHLHPTYMSAPTRCFGCPQSHRLWIRLGLGS